MLRRGGRFAGYVIHTPDGLSEVAEQRVRELVPMEALAEAPPAELTRRAGFAVVASEDVTDQFRATGLAVVRARERYEAELRAADGDEVYEDDQQRKVAVLTGIDEGLLLRSMIAARAP